MKTGLQGIVSLYLEVDAGGRTSNIEVLHGSGLGLDEMAVNAVKKWRYAPSAVAGQNKMAQSADVSFSLSGASPWRIRLAAYSNEGPNAKKSRSKSFLVKYAAPESAACPSGRGQAIVTFDVDAEGIPRNIKLETPSDAAGVAVVKAVSSWRFTGGESDPKKEKTEGSVEFECGESLDSRIFNVGNGIAAPSATYKPEPS